MLLDGREITTPDFELMGPDDELEIVMAAPTHDVIGRFAWPEPAPVNASVILVPEQPRSGDYEIVHHTDLDQNGDFTFYHISPGRYRAFVVTRYDAGLWENRDLFRQVADRGTLVEVPEGASGPDAIRITPKLLPAAVLDHAVARIGN